MNTANCTKLISPNDQEKMTSIASNEDPRSYYPIEFLIASNLIHIESYSKEIFLLFLTHFM